MQRLLPERIKEEEVGVVQGDDRDQGRGDLVRDPAIAEADQGAVVVVHHPDVVTPTDLRARNLGHVLLKNLDLGQGKRES